MCLSRTRLPRESKFNGLVDISGFSRSVILRHPSRSYPVEKMLHSPRCARSSKVRHFFCAFPHSSLRADLDLMAENQTLRGLLRSLSAFIGEGAGGVLPKLGWSLNDFEDYVNRTETDTAWESFQKNKRDRQSTQPEASTSQPPASSRKRAAEDASSKRNKRQRSMTADEEHSNDFPVLGNPVPTNGNTYNDLLRTNPTGSPMFMTPQSATSQGSYPAPGSGNAPFASAGSGSTPSFLHGLGLESAANNPADSVSLSLPPSRINQSSTAMAEIPEESETFDPKFEEAGKLIAYAQTLSLLTYRN